MIVNFPPQLWSARPQPCLDFHSYGADIHNCSSLTTLWTWRTQLWKAFHGYGFGANEE